MPKSRIRLYMDITVSIALTALLVVGSVFIYGLNADARRLEFADTQAMQGQAISTQQGCIACHTVDGSRGVGPSWLGMFGKQEMLENGEIVTVDENYFRESITRPGIKVVAGYPNVMIPYFLPDEDIDALLAFAKRLAQTQDLPDNSLFEEAR